MKKGVCFSYTPRFHPVEVAWWLHSFWQGSMHLTKKRQDPAMIQANLRHTRRYINSLFPQPNKTTKPNRKP